MLLIVAGKHQHQRVKVLQKAHYQVLDHILPQNNLHVVIVTWLVEKQVQYLGVIATMSRRNILYHLQRQILHMKAPH